MTEKVKQSIADRAYNYPSIWKDELKDEPFMQYIVVCAYTAGAKDQWEIDNA